MYNIVLRNFPASRCTKELPSSLTLLRATWLYYTVILLKQYLGPYDKLRRFEKALIQKPTTKLKLQRGWQSLNATYLSCLFLGATNLSRCTLFLAKYVALLQFFFNFSSLPNLILSPAVVGYTVVVSPPFSFIYNCTCSLTVLLKSIYVMYVSSFSWFFS